MVKYSLIVPYYKRYGHFENTLVSYLHHYGQRNDYEVIVVESAKNIANDEEHNNLLNLIDKFKNKIEIVHIEHDTESHNPAKQFNDAAKIAKGEFLVLTNPECFHKANVLAGFDDVFKQDREAYIVCGCISALNCSLNIESFKDFTFKPEIWYQHSRFNDRRLHFCTAISKLGYTIVGGFDENYTKGVAYEDNDFVRTIKHFGIRMILRDDLTVIHIDHERSYQSKELVKINHDYFHNKWKNRLGDKYQPPQIPIGQLKSQ